MLVGKLAIEKVRTVSFSHHMFYQCWVNDHDTNTTHSPTRQDFVI